MSNSAKLNFDEWLQTTQVLAQSDHTPVVSELEMELLDSTLRAQKSMLETAKSQANVAKAAFEKEAKILMARATNMNQILKTIRE